MELTKIRGINEKRELDLNKMEIYDTASLMRFFPRRYVDLRSKQLLKYAYDNDMVLTVGKVILEPTVRYFRRGGTANAICEQEDLTFKVIWFNQPYVASKLKVGEEYLFYGRVKKDSFGGVTLINPSYEPCEKAFRLKGIVPQYQLKGNLTQKVLRDAVRLSVDIEKPKSVIPDRLLKKYALSDLYSAYREVHNPSSFNSLDNASDRIAVEEYFALISAFKIIKGDRENFRQNKYSVSTEELNAFIKNRFPFEFTAGQKNAVNEIYQDMLGDKVMNRLMQGDVGSGKTAVSNCAVFIALKSGYQVSMLAPTEMLAVQNYNVLRKVFPEYNIALLTGSTPLKEKKAIKEGLKDGNIRLAVGTHALLTEDVSFENLSLCICDEQQRFGVAQRSSLSNKGVMPDVLVMSATPIPRTVSLIFYGDLDITTITDKPVGRTPVQTNFVPKEKYEGMLSFISAEAEKGNQTYFVCPKIDGDDEGTIMSATALYEEIKEKLPFRKIALLHGKIKDKEKAQIMQDFRDKKYDILVSTVVIEVGVDVPDATVIVIRNAERFGLAQLHQLRGRVGRSNKKSYCFLTGEFHTPESEQRVKILIESNDGFKISECDYKLRGGGDFMGSRQSGKTITDLGHLSYGPNAIFLAKKLCDECFETGENLEQIKKVAISKYEKLKDITLN